MKNKLHDVIVVGAGPVGSYTAYLLAKAGLDVGIFERNPVIGKDVNCTGIVSGECLKKFDLPEEAILRPINL
jgi:flavin-dependent dehydrogenase